MLSNGEAGITLHTFLVLYTADSQMTALFETVSNLVEGERVATLPA
jgi:hypothetical protein